MIRNEMTFRLMPGKHIDTTSLLNRLKDHKRALDDFTGYDVIKKFRATR